MSRVHARLIGLGVMVLLAPAAFAGNYGTGGGVGAEMPADTSSPPPADEGDQATPAPQSDETGATPPETPDSQAPDSQSTTPEAPPAEAPPADQQK